MQLCTGLGVLDVLADHVALEQRHLADIRGDDEHGDLAEWRNLQEPVRLVGQIDVDPLERHALFVQRDHRALHIGTKLVADQFQRRGHGDPRQFKASASK